MPFQELDTVVLDRDLPNYRLQRGDVGAVVYRYEQNTALEVEFVVADGTTVAVVTLAPADVRPMANHEILHVREVTSKLNSTHIQHRRNRCPLF